VAAYGVWALLVVLYLESLGAPLPGESALVASAFLASTGELLLTHVLLASFIGAVAGDSTGYMIGRAGGRPLLLKFGPKLGLTPERLQRVERLFERRGVWVVLTARFVVLLRQLNGLIAGSMRMPFSRFVMANAAGAALWVGVWVLIGYTFGHELA
jgi:membrane protein DedA with SNARE-associated domain